jgi:HTH-type transcriptional regulator/antitoxin HigA
MSAIKYCVIKSRQQYDKYCNLLETLVLKNDNHDRDEIELLTLLIESWDNKQHQINDADPIQLLRFIMKEQNLKATKLASILHISRGAMSNILHYRRRLTAEQIRILANYFGIRQEALNQSYALVAEHGNILIESN